MVIKLLMFFVLFTLICNAEELDHIMLTQKALMSYESVREKSKELGQRLKDMTFGKNTEKLLFLAPLIDGRIRFEIANIKLKFNTRKEKGSIQYVYKF